jgi:uncharacterized protein YjbI with pentapeptide repeats
LAAILEWTFTRIDLREVDLSGANIIRSKFIRCDLDGCQLERADYRGTLFVETSLRYAQISSYEHTDVQFIACDLTGADMNNLKPRGERAVMGDPLFEGCNLTDVTLNRVKNLDPMDFVNCWAWQGGEPNLPKGFSVGTVLDPGNDSERRWWFQSLPLDERTFNAARLGHTNFCQS